jgi:hypothetical protein
MSVNISIHIGTLKVTQMTTASTLAIGQSGIANRNNSKSNTGPQAIGDGMVSMPIGTQITNDPDHHDTVEIAGNNTVQAPAF